MNEIEVVDGKVQIANEWIKKVSNLNAEIEKNKAKLQKYQEDLQNAMINADYKSIDNELFKVTHVITKERVTKKVDFDSLKEQGLYDDFVTEVHSAGSESRRWTWR